MDVKEFAKNSLLVFTYERGMAMADIEEARIAAARLPNLHMFVPAGISVTAPMESRQDVVLSDQWRAHPDGRVLQVAVFEPTRGAHGLWGLIDRATDTVHWYPLEQVKTWPLWPPRVKSESASPARTPPDSH